MISISRRFLSNSSSHFAKASLRHLPFLVSHQIRHLSAKPRFDFGGIREPKDATALFQEMLRMRPLPPLVDFTQLFGVLVDMKQYSLALQMLDEMLWRDASIKRSTFNIVMSLFHRMVRMRPPPSVFDFTKFWSGVIKIKQYSVALHLFHHMLRMDAPVDGYSLSIAINCFCCVKRPDFGFAVLGSFFKRGYEPNVVTFTTLLKGLKLVGKIQEAAKLLGKLLAEQVCYPNEVTYLTIINGLCKAGHTLDALDLLGSFEKGSCKPNVYAYSTVIDRLCKDGMVDDALQLFSSLAEKGVPPNVVTYSSMIEGLCKVGRWEEIDGLLKKMVARDIHPNVVTCNLIVDALCKEGRVEEAGNILKTMKEIDVHPTIITYNTMVNGYCMLGVMDEARNIFDSLLDSGIKPDIFSYNTLMNGYSKEGRVDEVFCLFTEIHVKGLERNVVSYNTMLHSLFCAGRWDEGLKLFREMQARKLPCDIVTYNTLLDGLCIAHRISEAFYVLHTMKDTGIIADIVTYSVLIEGLCKDEKVDMAKGIFDKLQSIGLQPDVVTYNILIGALSTEGRIEEAKKLVIQMVRNDCLPNSVTYIVFLQGLVKIKVLHETIPILEEMERRGFKLNAKTFSMLIQLLEEEGGDGVLFDKVRVMQWDSTSLVEESVNRCNLIWESLEPEKKQHCLGLLFYHELLQLFYLLRICDYKTATQRLDKLDAAMKSDLQRMQHTRDFASELDALNQTLSRSDLNYKDRSALSEKQSKLEEQLSNYRGETSTGKALLEPAYFGNVKRAWADKLELAPPPIDGEWLPKSAVYALVDLMVVVFNRPKGLFKECQKRIESGVLIIQEELVQLGVVEGITEVELQHSAIWMAGVYLMLLMQFLENKVAIELTRSEFVEAQEALVQMRNWFVRFPTILQACESTVEILRLSLSATGQPGNHPQYLIIFSYFHIINIFPTQPPFNLTLYQQPPQPPQPHHYYFMHSM